jgi:raffinose/stachyose/melibiose transport system substrate-binding protein
MKKRIDRISSSALQSANGAGSGAEQSSDGKGCGMQQMKQPWVLVIFLVIGLTLSLAAYAEGGKEGTSASAGSSLVSVEYWPNNTSDEIWVAPIIKEFEAANPDVKMKYNKDTNIHTGGDTAAIMKVAAQTDSLPECWYAYGGSIGGVWVDSGFAANLDAWAKAHNWTKKFNPAALKLVTWDGVLRAVPLQVNAMGIYYNKAVFAKLGIEVPKTFAQLEAACAKIKAAGIIPFGIGGKGDWMTMRFQECIIEAKAGSALHDKLVNFEVSWNNKAMLEVYRVLRDWTAKEYFPMGFMGLEGGELRPLLYTGKVAMVLDGNWFQKNIKADGQDFNNFGFFVFPTDQKPPRMSSFAVNTMINSHKPKANQEAALRFSEFLTDVKTESKYGSLIGAPLATIGVAYTDATPFVDIFVDALKKGNWIVTDQKLPADFKPAFYEAQDKAITGEWTPEQAVAFIAKAVDDWKAKNKK